MSYVIYLKDQKYHTEKTKAAATKLINNVSKRLNISKSKFKMKKLNLPKYKVGQRFFSYLNPTVKRGITKVYPSDDPKYEHTYKLSLRDKDGYSYSSKYINESSLSKKKLR